jgi:hypothetical protein
MTTKQGTNPLGYVVHFGGTAPPGRGHLRPRLARCGGGGGLGLAGTLGVLAIEPLPLAAPVADACWLRGGAEATVRPPRRRRLHRRRLVAAPPAARIRAAHSRRQGSVRRAAGDHHLVAPTDAGPDRAQHRRRRRLMTRRLVPRAGQLRQVVPVPEADRLLPGPRHARRRRLGQRHQAAGGRLRHHRTVPVVVFRWWNDDAPLTGRLDGGRRRCFAEQVREDVERIGNREREPKARLVFWRRGSCSRSRSRRRRWHARCRLLRPRRQLPVGLALHDDMAVAPQQLHEVVVLAARNGRIFSSISASHKKTDGFDENE